MSHVTFHEDVYGTIKFSSTRNAQIVRTSKWPKKCAPSCAAYMKTKFLLVLPHRSFNLDECQSARIYEFDVLRLDPGYSGRIFPTFRKKDFHPSYSLKM